MNILASRHGFDLDSFDVKNPGSQKKFSLQRLPKSICIYNCGHWIPHLMFILALTAFVSTGYVHVLLKQALVKNSWETTISNVWFSQCSYFWHVFCSQIICHNTLLAPNNGCIWTFFLLVKYSTTVKVISSLRLKNEVLFYQRKGSTWTVHINVKLQWLTWTQPVSAKIFKKMKTGLGQHPISDIRKPLSDIWEAS